MSARRKISTTKTVDVARTLGRPAKPSPLAIFITYMEPPLLVPVFLGLALAAFSYALN